MANGLTEIMNGFSNRIIDSLDLQKFTAAQSNRMGGRGGALDTVAGLAEDAAKAMNAVKTLALSDNPQDQGQMISKSLELQQINAKLNELSKAISSLTRAIKDATMAALS